MALTRGDFGGLAFPLLFAVAGLMLLARSGQTSLRFPGTDLERGLERLFALLLPTRKRDDQRDRPTRLRPRATAGQAQTWRSTLGEGASADRDGRLRDCLASRCALRVDRRRARSGARRRGRERAQSRASKCRHRPDPCRRSSLDARVRAGCPPRWCRPYEPRRTAPRPRTRPSWRRAANALRRRRRGGWRQRQPPPERRRATQYVPRSRGRLLRPRRLDANPRARCVHSRGRHDGPGSGTKPSLSEASADSPVALNGLTGVR